MLKLIVGDGDGLHRLVTLQHQFADLLQDLALDTKELRVALICFRDA